MATSLGREFAFRISVDEIKEPLPEYDLFIGACGSDDRAYVALRKLNVRKPKNVILFDYKERTEGLTEKSQYEAYKGHTAAPAILSCSTHDTTCNMRNFVQLARDIENIKQVALDISVFTKPYFIATLKALKDFLGVTSVDTFYTEPSSYYRSRGPGGFDLSSGSYETIEVPGFSGSRMARNERLLIILLGFEGKASSFIWDDIQPTVTVPINGFPAYILHFKDMSIMSNRRFLEQVEIRKAIRFAPANDPFETSNTIEDICKEYPNHAVTIAPLGPKPMALGAAIYALRRPDVRIAYALPSRFKNKESKEFGTCWLYRVELKQPQAVTP